MTDQIEQPTLDQSAEPADPELETETNAPDEAPDDDTDGETQTAEEESAEPTPEKFTLQSVSRRYYSPDKIADANVYIQLVVDTGARIRRNFDPAVVIPDGFGVAIVPLVKRTKSNETGNVTIGVAIAIVPDPDTVASHDKGQLFVRELIVDAMLSKIANTARDRVSTKDGKTIEGTMPKSIEEFLENRKSKQSAKTFNEVGPDMVKSLKDIGIKFMSMQILRQICQSSAFTKERFPEIPAGDWQAVIATLIQMAQGRDLDPAVLVNWRDTRDEVELAKVTKINMDALSDLV